MSQAEAVIVRGGAGYLHQCQDEEILLVGPAGSGKTVSALKKVVDACYGFPGSQHLICRQTRASMTDSTLVTLESIIGERHAEVMRVGRAQRHSYRVGGAEIVCAGLDEPSKAFGTAWGIVLLEEAVEATLDAWELFGRAARDPKLRRGGDSARFPYHQRIAVTNPGPPLHWLNVRANPAPTGLQRVISHDDWKKLWEYNSGSQIAQMRRLISVHQDNPTLFDARKEVWDWTEFGHKYIRSLSGMTGHRRARMLEGRWVAAQGSVFGADFDETRNICAPFPVPSSWPVWMYLDPGYDHPCGAFWLTMSPTGRRFVVAELYERERKVADLVRQIRELEAAQGLRPLRRFMDPNSGWSKSAVSDGVALIERYQAEGLYFSQWPRLAGKEKDAGVDAVRKFLIDGRLVVSTVCTNFMMELQSWSYKRNAKGERLPGDDQYVDTLNDLLDGCIGSCVQDLRFNEINPPKYDDSVIMDPFTGQPWVVREA